LILYALYKTVYMSENHLSVHPILFLQDRMSHAEEQNCGKIYFLERMDKIMETLDSVGTKLFVLAALKELSFIFHDSFFCLCCVVLVSVQYSLCLCCVVLVSAHYRLCLCCVVLVSVQYRLCLCCVVLLSAHYRLMGQDSIPTRYSLDGLGIKS
jgi:hypothetical protein